MQYLSLGAEIAASLAIPIFAGYLIDLYLDTSPWGVLTGVMVGIVIFILMIIRISNNLSKNND